MKVLVLGGAGFIGPRVMQRLLERGHEVACMDINTELADARRRSGTGSSRCAATSRCSTTSSRP